MDHVSGLDTVILCGGLGTRLAPVVGDRPKGLAAIRGKPFLDILVDDLRQQGLRRFIFCVGYLKVQIVRHFSGRGDAEYLFSEEEIPLGTGGAIANALPLIRSDPFLVLNGDSFCRVDFAELLRFHGEKSAEITLVSAPLGERKDGGTLRLDGQSRVASFEEKRPPGNAPSLINAGIYVIQRKSAERWLPPRALSLEREVLPEFVAKKVCFGFKGASEVIDIGTPERYQDAQHNLP